MLSLLPRTNQDQPAESLDTPTSRAAQACLTCRKQKRKCDKLLPSCSRCASLQRICDYSDSGSGVVPTAEDFAALQSKLNDLEGRLNSRAADESSTNFNTSDTHIDSLELDSGNHVTTPNWTNKFPSVLFLDMDVYKYANTIPPKPEVDIPLVSNMMIQMSYFKRQEGVCSVGHHQRTLAPVPRLPSGKMFLSERMRLPVYNVVYIGSKSRMLGFPQVGPFCDRLLYTTISYAIKSKHFTLCIPPNNIFLCWPAPAPVPNVGANDTQDVLDALCSSEVIQNAVSVYFNTIHKWFPFISRKRMNLGISLAGGGPDMTLLLLAIKLITTTPPQSQSAAKIPSYWTTKNFLHRLEVAGTTSILYLQSQILIALFEYSHALYPAAYLSVGSCVRYASLLGLPSYAEASAVLGPCKVGVSYLFFLTFP